MRAPFVRPLLLAVLAASPTAFATGYTDQAAFEAAAGAFQVDTFESYGSNFVPLTGLPALGIVFDPLSDGVHYPTVENTSIGGCASSGTQLLGNNDANKLPADGDLTIRPSGLPLLAIGYWNVGSDDRTTLSVYDVNNQLIESITTPSVTNNLSFQGIVTTTPIYSAVISETPASGNGWWTIDDLHVTLVVPEPASVGILLLAALFRPSRRRRP